MVKLSVSVDLHGLKGEYSDLAERLARESLWKEAGREMDDGRVYRVRYERSEHPGRKLSEGGHSSVVVLTVDVEKLDADGGEA